MTIETGNLFDDIPENPGEELFSELCRHDHVKIERIVSTGHSSPESGWYDQDTHEWVIVVQGEAKVAFDDGTSVKLVAGSYLNIPSHKKHRVAWTAPDRQTVWLAVHYK